MDSDLAKLSAVEMRLREVIRALVKQRTAHDKPLSWRVMFEIEDEAMALLQCDPGLDLHYLNLMVSPSAQRRPKTEEPAGLADLYAMHTALWMIQEAYYHAH